jgi:hypothetical protein
MIKARLELAFAVVFAVLATVTAIWPTWLETVTGMDPDGGSGETEWAIIAVFAIVAVVAAALSWRAYRRVADEA